MTEALTKHPIEGCEVNGVKFRVCWLGNKKNGVKPSLGNFYEKFIGGQWIEATAKDIENLNKELSTIDIDWYTKGNYQIIKRA